MGKKSRTTRSTGSPATQSHAEAVSVPVVGGREPCPCGSGRRYKACHGRAVREDFTRLVARPFEGLTGECDLVALREIVPAATLSLRTRAEFGGSDFTIATVLPMAWPALRRADGRVLVGLQTASSSGDASRDVAASLLKALAAEPGSPLVSGGEPGLVDGVPAPRLQEVIEADSVISPILHEGFEFWIGEGVDITPDVRESLERANGALVPTRRLEGVEAAYWARVDGKRHLRWVLPHEEEAFLDALARLHAGSASGVGPGSRYIGSFRAHGLVVPVWDLAAEVEAEDVEKPAQDFEQRLLEALSVEVPLTAQERSARSGLAARQLTLR